MNASEPHHVTRRKLQCLVLGAGGAGKTSLLRRYFHNTFDGAARLPTLGSDFYSSRVVVSNPATTVEPNNTQQAVTVMLQMWDTPGRERFALKRQRTYEAALSDSFFNHADAIMLVYDMTSSTSFTQLLKWYADLMEQEKAKSLPILIVASKLDLFQSNRHGDLNRPSLVKRRDVMGLRGRYNGKDFRYEYQVSSVGPAEHPSNEQRQKRMEMASYLANRENWTTDWSYLDSLLNSEDLSHPDRDMVLLWCMRNGLKHMEVSAATGEGINEAIETVIRVVLDAKQSEQRIGAQGAPTPTATAATALTNRKMDFQERYAPKNDTLSFLWRPILLIIRHLQNSLAE